jgi:type II secretory pathway component HofQ
MRCSSLFLFLITLVALFTPVMGFGYDQKEIERILNSGSKTYSDKKISLDVFNIPVRSVLDIIAKAGNKNIVVHKKVQGNITLNVKDVPWDLLLEMVVRLEGLYDSHTGGVIMIVPIEDAPSTMGAGR